MSRIILNSEIINELISSNSLIMQTKFQRGSDGKNYYFSPTISLKLFNPKVSWVDQYKKNLSFCFNKYENINLLTMLRYINTKLIELYNKKSDNPVNVAPFYFEKDDNFYIRCYLPNVKGKYYITSSFNNNEESFNIPRIGATYTHVVIDIRNIWENHNRSGFNLELKETDIII